MSWSLHSFKVGKISSVRKYLKSVSFRVIFEINDKNKCPKDFIFLVVIFILKINPYCNITHSVQQESNYLKNAAIFRLMFVCRNTFERKREVCIVIHSLFCKLCYRTINESYENVIKMNFLSCIMFF